MPNDIGGTAIVQAVNNEPDQKREQDVASWRSWVYRPELKVAIFGTTPSRMEGPHQDDSGWQRWTIGPGGMDVHGWERLYEVHRTWPPEFKEYLDKLRAVEPPKEVRTLIPLVGAKSNVVLDRDAYFEKYGRMWFSSSISYCLAEAIEQGATDIGLWGIDLESGEEYISQFAGCKFFISLAILLGINISLPKDCGLLRDVNPYPDRYESHLALTFERKRKWLDQILAQQEPQYDSLKAEVHRQEGRCLMLKSIGAEAKDIEEAERRLLQLNMQLGALTSNINQLKGERGATTYYQRMYVWGMTEPDESFLAQQPGG